MLTAERLRELLHYDPETGVFTWLKSTNNTVCIGQRAGSSGARGRRQIRIDGRLYYEHRLAWLHVKGSWPHDLIDHKDGVPSHNWFKNLREATHPQNGANSKRRSDNKSGRTGVSWHKKSGRWVAQIKANGGVGKFLGRFKTFEEAVAVRSKAEEELQGTFRKAHV